jgi:hypothetical protein
MADQAIRSEEDILLERILQRSTTDTEFRARALEDAHAAIEEVLGVPRNTLPQTMRVKFIEKDADVDTLIVLPDFADAEGQLSDSELESVAGGCWVTSCWMSVSICLVTDDNTVKVDNCN